MSGAVPFYAISLLAGCRPSPRMHEAAAIDGGKELGQRFARDLAAAVAVTLVIRAVLR